MTQNPIVQYIFMVIGILCLIRLLAMSTLLLTLALLISGLFALTIWLISEDKKTTDTICKYPAGNHWVNFVQNISKVMSPPPDPEIPDAGGDDDDGDEGRKKGRVKIYMNEPEHFYEGKKWFKQYFKGHDDDIQVLFTNLETSIEMYSRSVEKEHQLRKPIASYLIIGPTGTGKTYCSELMSKLLYPKKGFLYLDLALLKDEYGVNLLFGESGGSSNYNFNRNFNRNNDQGGLLTSPILKNPYQMVLLDEIGRCHPAIHDSLYHVLDKGKSIEKSSGREVDFTNCVFFATANVSDVAQRKLDAEKKKNLSPELWKKELIEVLSAEMGFEYPFLARFDMIFYFPALVDINAAEVAILKLIEVYKANDITMTYVEPEVIFEALERIQPVRNLGVREMKNVIENMTRQTILEAKRQEIDHVQLNVNGIGEVCLLNQDTKREIKTLDQMDTSEIALLQLSKHYRHFGLRLSYDEPEMIVKAVENVNKTNKTNPDEISRTIFNMVKPQMVQASKENVKKVELKLNESGKPCLIYS